MESKDELVFVDFFFSSNTLFLFAINIAFDLFKLSKRILVTNVAYN
jgi:hypothetical protein